MNKQQVDDYVIRTTNEFPELKEHEGSVYIKWDNMPYPLREYIFSRQDYDENLMVGLDRSCGCGRAYFYDAVKFYLYLMDWEEPKK